MPLNDNTAKWGVRKLTDFKGNGLPVGFEYFSTNPNIPIGSLPLFGGEYSRTVYSDLWSWVQEQPNYLLTESEWQAKASANDGNVPYYSSGDGSTTFRVPSLKCWVKGANGIEEVGSYLSAGLPNLNGVFETRSTYFSSSDISPSHFNATNPFSAYQNNSNSNLYAVASSVTGKRSVVEFNASRSNPIYGNSDTVQPKSIVGMWLVKAYGTVSNVGSTDVSAIAVGLTEAENRISAIEDNKVDKAGNAWVVETYRNGDSWYRIYTDGWCEQGGAFGGYDNVTVQYLKKFKDATSHTVLLLGNSISNYGDNGSTANFGTLRALFAVYNKSSTGFTSIGTYSRADKIKWYACGYLAEGEY